MKTHHWRKCLIWAGLLKMEKILMAVIIQQKQMLTWFYKFPRNVLYEKIWKCAWWMRLEDVNTAINNSMAAQNIMEMTEYVFPFPMSGNWNDQTEIQHFADQCWSWRGCQEKRFHDLCSSKILIESKAVKQSKNIFLCLPWESIRQFNVLFCYVNVLFWAPNVLFFIIPVNNMEIPVF